jgi:hypothetical protein
MEILLILLALSNLVMIIGMIILGFLVHSTMKSNFVLQDIVDTYYGFLSDIDAILGNDVEFLKSSLVQKLSMSIPEVRDLNHALNKFQNNLEITKIAVAKFKEGQK